MQLQKLSFKESVYYCIFNNSQFTENKICRFLKKLKTSRLNLDYKASSASSETVSSFEVIIMF